MDHDLGGYWSGWYDYAPGHHLTAFSASLMVAPDGTLTGTTLELSPRAGERTARLDGHHEGAYVDWMKHYDQTDDGYASVISYAGEVSGDGNTISGIWAIELGEDFFGTVMRATGRFEMVRASDWTGARAEVGETVAR